MDDEDTSGVETAEGELLRLGLGAVRVCPHGDAALLAVPLEQLPLLADEPLRGAVVRAVRRAGFAHVGLDLEAR
ncbi:hypothetical protein ET475_07780 [Microbacterium protaetiae]|uniref:Uncharacterized protein n=1 Tax=Microbacterium protaetiae TaxID=2509458 RepID=A0A4V0YD92_9MICO|nr:hypothetical protein [Microbacterium protaetiae]QAY59901.1 hypothetical protein ET475_07780 [Microbacterium protaetiae]